MTGGWHGEHDGREPARTFVLGESAVNAPVPNATLSVAAILAEGAKRHGDLPAITLGGASTSYKDLWDQTRAYAGALREAGVGELD